eukprot:scaffold5019_cov131-Skeletonema_dohrnii-CCMP3373.AAC.3
MNFPFEVYSLCTLECNKVVQVQVQARVSHDILSPLGVGAASSARKCHWSASLHDAEFGGSRPS